MVNTAIDDIRHDPLAISMAHALALANDAAKLRGTDLSSCIVTVSEESPPPRRRWRVHYGPRDYLNRRGGDLVVLVDETKGVVTEVLKGQ